jgi:hypothetical protein
MAIDNDPIFTLDIIGAEGDVGATNCILRKNKTNMLGRGSLDYIVSLRDSILTGRRFKIPGMWDHSWSITKGPIWTPKEISSNEKLETWLMPEYFRPETSAPSLCIEATNYIDALSMPLSPKGFEQINETSMPAFNSPSTLFMRQFEGLGFDGSRTVMRGMANDMWNVGEEDFMIIVVIQTDGCEGDEPVLTKKNTSHPYLSVDFTDSNKDIFFTTGGQEISFENAAMAGRLIISCGRKNGTAILYSNGEESVLPTSPNTDDVSVTKKPYLGTDSGLGAAHFNGTIFEVIFINEAKTGDTLVTTGMREKIEGYLAHKYLMQEYLVSEHPYKNEPPRASVQE